MYFFTSIQRALADWIYKNQPDWNSLNYLEIDLRIDKEELEEAEKNVLKYLIQNKLNKKNMKQNLLNGIL